MFIHFILYHSFGRIIEILLAFFFSLSRILIAKKHPYDFALLITVDETAEIMKNNKIDKSDD